MRSYNFAAVMLYSAVFKTMQRSYVNSLCFFPEGRQIHVQIYSHNANPTPHAKDMSSTVPPTQTSLHNNEHRVNATLPATRNLDIRTPHHIRKHVFIPDLVLKDSPISTTPTHPECHHNNCSERKPWNPGRPT